jgi:hypothetical protein
MADLRLCSTCRSHSQASFYHYAHPLGSVQCELTFARFRYSLGKCVTRGHGHVYIISAGTYGMINTISIALGTVSFEMIVSYEGSKQYLVLKRRKRHSKELFFATRFPSNTEGNSIIRMIVQTFSSSFCEGIAQQCFTCVKALRSSASPV